MNAGFVQGFWYSTNSPFANEPVRIYVAIRNNTGADLTGAVTFFDNDTRLGSQAVTALDNRIIESWIDWTPSYGEHTLRAELSRVTLSAIGSTTKSIDVALGSAEETLFVDIDTDHDRLGNAIDLDDDADGISDESEHARGSDPLVAAPNPTAASLSATSNDQTTTVPNTSPLHTNTPTGLERYLAPSPVADILNSISETSAAAKAKLDTYRVNRVKLVDTEATATASTSDAIGDNGFGSVTRSAASPTESKGMVARLTQAATSLGNILYTFSLFSLSWFLNHPGLIQVLLLFVILFIIYRTARHLGRRPRTRL